MINRIRPSNKGCMPRAAALRTAPSSPALCDHFKFQNFGNFARLKLEALALQ